MNLRRLAVSAVLLVTAGAGAGFATDAGASTSTTTGAAGCANGLVCTPYDVAKSETAAVLGEAAFACTSFRDVPCATVDGAGQTVYNDVFFPYQACYTVNGTTECVGPIG